MSRRASSLSKWVEVSGGHCHYAASMLIWFWEALTRSQKTKRTCTSGLYRPFHAYFISLYLLLGSEIEQLFDISGTSYPWILLFHMKSETSPPDTYALPFPSLPSPFSLFNSELSLKLISNELFKEAFLACPPHNWNRVSGPLFISQLTLQSFSTAPTGVWPSTVSGGTLHSICVSPIHI